MALAHLTAKIAFYDVIRCGYYPHRDMRGFFSNLHDTLTGLHQWVTRPGVSLSNTATYEPSEDSDDLGVYCYDMAHDLNSDDCLLTTWNATPNSNGQAMAVNGAMPVGKAEVAESDFNDGYIPGFETYFWFIPEREVFATIRFDRTNNAQQNMRRYLYGYLINFSPYVYTYDKDGEEHTYYGQSADEDRKFRPLFMTERRRLPGKLDFIRAKRSDIVKSVQKTVLHPFAQATDNALWQAMLGKMGVKRPAVEEQEISIRNEVCMTPTEEELANIIQQWREDEANNGTGDIGFCLRGNTQEIHWLSSSMAKAEWPVIVERDEHNIVEANSLLHALASNRGEILKHVTSKEQD